MDRWFRTDAERHKCSTRLEQGSAVVGVVNAQLLQLLVGGLEQRPAVESAAGEGRVHLGRRAERLHLRPHAYLRRGP